MQKFLIGTLLVFLTNSLWADTKEELALTQEQIKAKQNQITANQAQLTNLQTNLKEQETKISYVEQNLQALQNKMQEIKQNIQNIQKEIREIKKQEQEQKQKLAKQVEAVYKKIPKNFASNLLTGNVEKNEIFKQHYKAFHRARLDAIEKLYNLKQELKNKTFSLQEQNNQERTQFVNYQTEKRSLNDLIQERRKTINQINLELTTNQRKLEQLKANEKALLEALNKAKQNTEGNGLKRQKIYNLPVQGVITNRFGKDWNGLVIAAKAGTPVKAIESGKVILADWIQGYGNIVGIDHGKSYVSLYGYNKFLKVQKGDFVAKGQIIGLVGNSGGQNNTGSYFGITNQGVAVDPELFIKK